MRAATPPASAVTKTNDLASGSGAVYVFTRSGSTWSQQAYVKASNTAQYDYFGAALNISADGSTLAVGAKNESTSGYASGAVYVFTRSLGIWSQQAYLKASNPDAVDYFGSALSLSDDGNTLAVGAPDEDSNATGTKSIWPLPWQRR